MGCGSSSKVKEPEKPDDDDGQEKRPPQPSPPPPYILQEIFADLVANIKGVSSKTGKADKDGLVSLINEISIIGRGDPATMPKNEDIDKVLEILDCNGNGFIEYGEFLHWVALQCGLSTSERNKKRKQSDLHDRLQNLVLCIRKAAKIMLIEKREIEARLAPLEKGVDIVFCEFDQDNSGFLNEEKITHLLQKLITPIGHKNDMGSDAREILFALDTDGNGYVEQQEFTDWVLSGLSRPKRSRDIFASHSDFHQRMEQMLTCIEREAMKAVGMKFPEPLDAPLTKDQKAVKDWSLDAPSSPNFDGEGGENGNDLFK